MYIEPQMIVECTFALFFSPNRTPKVAHEIAKNVYDPNVKCDVKKSAPGSPSPCPDENINSMCKSVPTRYAFS